jgi:sortase A
MATTPSPLPPTPPSRRRLPFRVGLALLVVAIVAGMVVLARGTGGPTPEPTADGSPGYAAGAAAGSATVSTAAPTTPPSTEAPTTQTTLPLPDPPPGDPYAPTPRVKVATLSIPRIGLTVDLLDGVTLTVIDQATGHWPGTPAPGGLGNLVVAGHRTVKQHPFNRLGELRPGDPVIFDAADGHRYTYQVRGTIIVPASSIGIISQSDAHTATLFACHPLGQSAQRIVVKLRLLDDKGEPVDPDAALPPMDIGNRTVDDTALVRDTSPDPSSDAPASNADPDPLSPSDTEPGP